MSKIGDNDDDSDYWKGSGKTPEAMKDPRIAQIQAYVAKLEKENAELRAENHKLRGYLHAF